MVREVEGVFLTLDAETAAFKEWSGLHCKSGCGKCCLKPDLEATILEFIPFAYYVYRQGKAVEWLEKLLVADSSTCQLFSATDLAAGMGQCSAYGYRGMICRLFGYSARVNKHGGRELVTCSIIKTGQAEAYQSAVQGIQQGQFVPRIGQYYMQLLAIDRELSRDYYPVNVAIRKALETVLHYYSYREESGLAVS